MLRGWFILTFEFEPVTYRLIDMHAATEFLMPFLLCNFMHKNGELRVKQKRNPIDKVPYIGVSHKSVNFSAFDMTGSSNLLIIHEGKTKDINTDREGGLEM